MDSAAIVKVIECLISPPKACNGELASSIENFLWLNIQTMLQYLQHSDITHQKFKDNLLIQHPVLQSDKIGFSNDRVTRWNFVQICLGLLKELASVLSEQSALCSNIDSNPYESSTNNISLKSKQILSVGEQKVVTNCLQFIVGLGISECLLPGVGISIEKRSEMFKYFKMSVLSLSEEECHANLCDIMQQILIVIANPQLGSIIVSKYLQDILAALLQLSFAPNHLGAMSTSEQKINESSDELFITNNSCNKHPRNLPTQKWFQQELHKLTERLYQPLLIRELFVLQGGHAKKTQKTPAWLQKACGELLSKALMRPEGLKNVLGGMFFNLTCSGEQAEIEWNKCVTIAKVVATCPKSVASLDVYYMHITPQVIGLLMLQDKLLARQYLRVAVSIIEIMWTKSAKLTKKHIMDVILATLLRCTTSSQLSQCTTSSLDSSSSLAASSILVDDRELEGVVELIHRVFVCGAGPSHSLISCLLPVIHVLFRLYVYSIDGIWRTKSLVTEVLVSFLKDSDPATSIACLLLFTMGHVGEHRNLEIPMFKMNLEFSSSPNGGIMIVVNETNSCSPSSSLVTVDMDCWRAVPALLAQVNQDALTGEFFLCLLKEFSELSGFECKDDIDSGTIKYDLEKCLAVLGLLGELCDQLGPACLQQTQHIMKFIQITLERSVRTSLTSSDEAMILFASESMTMAVGLLAALLDEDINAKVTIETWQEAEILQTLLMQVSEVHPQLEIGDLANGLRIAIATHGHISYDDAVLQSDFNLAKKSDCAQKSDLAQKSGNKITNPVQKKNILIEEIPDVKSEINLAQMSDLTNMSDLTQKSDLAQRSDNKTIKPEKKKNVLIEEVPDVCLHHLNRTNTDQRLVQNTSEFVVKNSVLVGNDGFKPVQEEKENTNNSNLNLEAALKDVNNPLAPIKGHGMISLRKLLEARDDRTLQRIGEILVVCQHCLDDDDSYVYLTTIQTLAALSDKRPAEVIQTVLNEFASWMVSSNKLEQRNVETRLKLGEVLVRATKCLGDLVPAYREPLIRAILSCAKDPEPLIRASAMSNLAEVCRLLHFSLGSVIHEIIECTSSVLCYDKSQEVRKGAALTVNLLLQGLGSDVFTVLGATLKNIYHLLKLCSSTEKDEGVLLHIHLALNELDNIMRSQLFSTQYKLEKELFVSKPPPTSF